MDRMTERRRDRRIPLGCKVGIRLEGQAAPVVGTCVELSVGGLTIHSSHVPRMDEVFEIAVLPPEPGGVYQPLHARGLQSFHRGCAVFLDDVADDERAEVLPAARDMHHRADFRRLSRLDADGLH